MSAIESGDHYFALPTDLSNGEFSIAGAYHRSLSLGVVMQRGCSDIPNLSPVVDNPLSTSFDLENRQARFQSVVYNTIVLHAPM